MNFQDLADRFHAPTCILSVEKKTADGYGDILIAAGNKQYIEPILHTEMLVTPGLSVQMPDKFVPNSPYYRYLPKDKGFEELCVRGALGKELMHTYVHINTMDIWFDIYVIPLDCDDDERCYCAYSAIPCSAGEIGLNSSNLGSSYEEILKTCVKLHETDNIQDTMQGIVRDVRMMARAEVCTILVMNNTNESVEAFAADHGEYSCVRSVTGFENFTEIAVSGAQMLGGTECIILKSPQDMEYLKDLNRLWYDTLVEAGADSIVLFPLKHDGAVLGFIWATNFDTENTMRIKEALELATFFISSKIAGHRMMERLKKISYTDVLTGLPNRFACTDRMAELVRKGESFTAVSIDISHFKSINESLGFESGNQVLIGIANRWRKLAEGGMTQTADYVARLSGDEFMLLISGYSSEEQMHGTIEQYRAALEKLLTVDECDLHMTASFGYAQYPADADSADQLMTCAGAAMREVKRVNSSNRIAGFVPELLKTERTLELEEKILTALENGTIFFNLQPQYDMSRRLRGFEALARMRDDNGTPISPGEFIPVAEKVGLIDKVDGMVFRKAMMFFGELLRDSGKKLILSVNASVRHLMKNDFLDEIRGLLSESGVPAECLEIEITESIMIDSAEKALQCINALKEMGIKLAIDDFGTGYSALSYLNSFPADLLKIDKTFIDKMNTTGTMRQYVAAIISMGHIMGFDVISEGVETQEQINTLNEIGCDYIQGFVWDRPLMPEDARKLVIKEQKG